MASYLVRRSALLFASFALLACGDEPSAPPAIPAILDFRLVPDTLAVGASLRIVAAPLDARGYDWADTLPVAWVSRAPDVVTVDSTGTVTGVSVGRATIVATAGGRTDSVTLVAARLPWDVLIVPPADTVRVGVYTRLGAVVRDRQGVHLPGLQVTSWAIADTSLGRMDAHGNVYLYGEGPVQVAASRGAAGGIAMIDGRQPYRDVGGRAYTGVSLGAYHGCGIRAGGALDCWGSNYQGQLGRGPGAGMWPDPAPVASALTFGSVATMWASSCGLATGGGLYCWGQYDRETPRHSDVPVRLLPDTVVTAFSAVQFADFSTMRHEAACALVADGRAVCWGSNDYLQLGHAGAAYDARALPVDGDLRFRDVAVGTNHVCALDLEGAAWCWGTFLHPDSSARGESRRTAPIRVQTSLRFTQVAAGSRFSCGIATDGLAYCWGSAANLLGAGLGGTYRSDPAPVPVAGGRTFARLQTHSVVTCGLTAGAELWCWGWPFIAETFGQSGVHRVPRRFSRQPIKAFAVDYYGLCAVTSTDRLICHGMNVPGRIM